MGDRTIKFLDKVLKDVVLDTKLYKLGLHLPFYKYGTIYVLSKKEVFKLLKNREYKYRDYFYGYVMDTYSLSIEEAFGIYPKYIKLLEDKFSEYRNINESRVKINLKLDTKQKKYLDKVVNYLVDSTKINKYKIITSSPFELPDGYEKSPHSHLSSPTPSLHSFMYQMKDIYGLSENEMLYVWQGYRDFILIDVFGEKSPIKSFSFDTINEEIMSPGVSKHVTHKGKLNFIDRVVDMMMRETYVTDIEHSPQNSHWYEEGMRKIYFFKGDNSLGRDDEEGIIKPGRSFSDFGNSYSQDTFSAVKSHLRRFGATNIDTDMEIYIWTEYLYRLREKYFGGGEGPPLARINKI